MHKIDNLWEPMEQHRELYSMHCGDLNEEEILKWGNIHIGAADSFYCTPEMNNIVKQL